MAEMEEKRFPTHIVAVSGVVENDRNEVLLIRQRAGHWAWTGGQVENGETLTQAVLREIMEESGVTARVGALFAVTSNTASYPGHSGYAVVPTKVMLDFICTYAGGELVLETDETLEAIWVPKDRVLDYLTTPALIERYKAYLEYRGSVRYLAYVTKPEYRLHEKREI